MGTAWIVWLVLFVGALVLESLSMQLFSVWFAAGALVSLVASLLHAQVWLQIVLFLAVTVGSLIATRPLVRRLQTKKMEPTNADRFVGKPALVLEDIDNVKGTGLIKVSGQEWTARTVDGGPIPAGEAVETVSIQGAKMLVRIAPGNEG